MLFVNLSFFFSLVAISFHKDLYEDLLVCVDAFCAVQQFISHVGKFLGLNQY